MTTKPRKFPLPTKAKMLASMEREESRWREKAFRLQALTTEAFEMELYWHELAVRLRTGPTQPELPLDVCPQPIHCDLTYCTLPLGHDGEHDLLIPGRPILREESLAAAIASKKRAEDGRAELVRQEAKAPDLHATGDEVTMGVRTTGVMSFGIPSAAPFATETAATAAGGPLQPPATETATPAGGPLQPPTETPIGDEQAAAGERVAQRRAYRQDNIACAKPAGTCAHPKTFIEDGIKTCATMLGSGA